MIEKNIFTRIDDWKIYKNNLRNQTIQKILKDFLKSDNKCLGKKAEENFRKFGKIITKSFEVLRKIFIKFKYLKMKL